jgi:outer membrane protein insertion porin family
MLLVCLAGQFRSGDTLEAVRFSGNRSFKTGILAGQVMAKPKKPTSESQLARDAAAIEAFYQSEGFDSVQVEKAVSRGRRRQVVTFLVTEGPRTRVATIVVSGNRAFPASRLGAMMPVRVGQPLSAAGVERAGQVLRTFYMNSGFPFVEVKVGTERRDTLATVEFAVAEGALCRIRNVLVRGNRTVRTYTVLRASEIRRGERFSEKRIYEAQRRLYATRLFSRVMFYVIRPDSVSDSVDVRFDVVEQAYRGVSLGGGVEYSPLRLLLSAEWEHNNVFNLNQTIRVGGEFSPALDLNYRAGLEGTYRVPYLVLTRIDFQTRPYFSYEKLASGRLRELGIETGMSRNVTPQLNFGLSNRLRIFADTASGITNLLAVTGQYDSRSDIFDPAGGLSLQAVAGLAGGLLFGDNDFYRVTADARWYQSLALGFVFAVRGMAGRAWPYGRSDSVPYSEAFTLGGRNTLRGYDERSIGPDSTPFGEFRYGPAVVNGNMELRSPYLLNWVGLVAFGDAGSVGRDLRLFAYEYSAGVGIRVKTPIGPVRVDWGKRLKNPPDKDKGRFYLGIMHAF